MRFAFFGGEEDNAVGSTGYVEGLSRMTARRSSCTSTSTWWLRRTAGYIVQGGTGDDEDAAGPPVRPPSGGCSPTELAKIGVTAPEIIEFVGDDESAFIEAGIPAGGAENGDAKQKTAEQARSWGGQAGEKYDRCYHQACDGIDNVNRDVLDHYLKAIAATLANFAASTEDVR